METLCFTGNYFKRFARVKEFSQEKVEFVLDEFLGQFCNLWPEEEYSAQCGANKYERSGELRQDFRSGYYQRRIITSRGIIKLRVPRG